MLQNLLKSAIYLKHKLFAFNTGFNISIDFVIFEFVSSFMDTLATVAKVTNVGARKYSVFDILYIFYFFETVALRLLRYI